MTLKDLEGIIEGTLLEDSSLIEHFSLDSRKTEKNSLFIPLKGVNFDGNNFIIDAISNGARAVLIEKDYERKDEVLDSIMKSDKKIGVIEVRDSFEALKKLAKYKRDNYQGKVIAITGSVGKTTTKELLSSVLSEKYNVFKSEKNYNNIIGLCQMLLKLDKEEIAVFELGMNHEHEIEEMSLLLRPDIAVITNIGTAHIGNLGSKENILKAKLEITKGMNRNGLLVLNGEDKMLQELAVDIPVVYYDTNGVRLTKIMEQLVIHLNDEVYVLDVIGNHYIITTMCILKMARLFDMNNSDIRRGLIMYKASDRSIKKEMINNTLIIDDTYNASYESMINGINYVLSLPHARKILVLGSMLEYGDKEKEYHHKLGEYLLDKKIAKVYGYGLAMKDMTDVLKDRALYFDSKELLINALKEELGDNTVIYFKASRKIMLEEVIRALEK